METPLKSVRREDLELAMRGQACNAMVSCRCSERRSDVTGQLTECWCDADVCDTMEKRQRGLSIKAIVVEMGFLLIAQCPI
jgi:hypothetical protein